MTNVGMTRGERTFREGRQKSRSVTFCGTELQRYSVSYNHGSDQKKKKKKKEKKKKRGN